MHISDFRKAWENYQASSWGRRFRQVNPGVRRRIPRSAKGLRILLIRNDRVGDMILTTPLFPALKKAGCSWLGLVASKSNSQVVANNPFLDHILIDDGRKTLEPYAIPGKGIDVALDLTGDFSLKAVLATARSGARVRGGPDHRWAQKYYDLIIDDLPVEARYETDRVRAQLGFLGKMSVFPLALYPNKNHKKEAQAELDRVGDPKKYILVSIGARRRSHSLGKGWIRILKAVGHGLGLPILLAWGPGEESLALKIQSSVGSRARLLGETGVQVLGCLASRASLFLTLETGSFHVGLASGARVVGIFGPLRNRRWHPAEGPRLGYVESPSLRKISTAVVLEVCRRLLRHA